MRYVTPCGVSSAGDSLAVPIHQPVVKPGGVSPYVATAVVEDVTVQPVPLAGHGGSACVRP